MQLFAGRRNFQDVVSIVKAANSPSWKEVKYHVFDVPSAGSEPFEKRMDILGKTFLDSSQEPEDGARFSGKCKVECVLVEQQTLVKDRDHVLEMLRGEGITSERDSRITPLDRCAITRRRGADAP